jgi:hypothetical protein
VVGFGRFVVFGKGETGRLGEVPGFRSDRGRVRCVCQHFSGVRVAFWPEWRLRCAADSETVEAPDERGKDFV